MILNSNIVLKHSIWYKMQDLYPVQNGPKPKIALFPRLIDAFIVACTIGMKANTRIENDEKEEVASVNSKTYNDPVNDDIKRTMDYMLKILILTMDLPELSGVSRNDKEKLAFASDFNIDKFNPINIMTEYANYGATKLVELMTDQDTETINNIIEYLDSLKLENEILPDIDDFGTI